MNKRAISIPATGICIKNDNINLQLGQKKQLNINVVPQIANYPQLIWSSMDKQIATVDDEGIVKLITQKAIRYIVLQKRMENIN